MSPPSGPPSYWLLADDQLAMSQDPGQIRQFLAHIKHALLFNRSLLVSDSQLLHNVNLRAALRGDSGVDRGEFRALLSPDTFGVAVRTNRTDVERRVLSLREVQADMLSKKKTVAPREVYANEDDLLFTERAATIVPYEEGAIGELYTRSVLRMFQDDLAGSVLGDRLAGVIRLLAEEHYQAHKSIGRYFFYYDLEGILPGHGFPHAFQEYGRTIRELASGPYLGALPSQVGANPIYAEEHRGAFELLRRRGRTVAGETLEFETRLDLTTYVEALIRLPAASVHELRGSDEADAFHAAVEGLDGTRATYRRLREALRDYQMKVEDEIFECVFDRGLHGQSRHTKYVHPFHVDSVTSFGTQRGAAAGVIYRASPEAGPLSLMVSVAVDSTAPAREGPEVVRARYVFDSEDHNEVMYYADRR